MPSVKKEHLEHVFSELNDLKSEKKELQDKIVSVNLELDALKVENDLLQSKFVNETSEIDVLREEKEHFRSKLFEVSSQINDFKVEKADLQSKFVSLTSNVDTLKEEKEHLQFELIKIESEAKTLIGENKQLESRIVTLNSELNVLEDKKNQLKSIYADSELKIGSLEKKAKRNKTILPVFIFVLAVVSFLFYLNNAKSKSELNSLKQTNLVLLDSIQKINLQPIPPSPVLVNEKPKVLYTLQLGVFKNVDVDFGTVENLNFKEIKTDQGNLYQLGSFTTYKFATVFKNEIKKMGLKDVFLVPYNENEERISIKEALILSNETEFIVE